MFAVSDDIFSAVIVFAGFAGSCSELKIVADSSDITVLNNIRSYLCTVCHKRYTSRRCLNYHRKRHTGENVCSCTQCDKRFSSRRVLSSHMNIHTGKYKCTECGRCCHSNQQLANHRRIHSGEKHFECTVCSKRYTGSYILAINYI